MAKRERQGGCMCGAVRFVARDVPGVYDICHCEMCRRWTGSSLLSVSVPSERVEWQGRKHVAVRQSSEWAERAWCTQCGSGLWFRVTDPENPGFGMTEIPLGLFDEPDGFVLESEIHVDVKPDSYAYRDEPHRKLTGRQCNEIYGSAE